MLSTRGEVTQRRTQTRCMALKLFWMAALTLQSCGYTQDSAVKPPAPVPTTDTPSGGPPRIPTEAECSCPTAATSQSGGAVFARTLVIGNSITFHPAEASQGWPYSNGMAATAPEKDYLHILTGRLQQAYPAASVVFDNGGPFEQSYWTYDLNQLSNAFTVKPNLIIVRISENINDQLVRANDFETHYRHLLDYIASKSAPGHKIICTTSFWNNPNSDAIIKKVAAERGYPLACLCKLVGRPEYMALEFKNKGVAIHPNDKAMAEIAQLIWEKVL